MNISLSEELQLFAQELYYHLSPKLLQRLAKDVGFVRRTSKYSGQDLVSLCVWLSQEVAECHIYGQLIRILICSSTMFQMRELLLRQRKRELSEYKAVYMIKDYLPLLYEAIQQNVEQLTSILFRLYTLLEKNGRKSHRYEKKTVFDILGVVYERSESIKKTA